MPTEREKTRNFQQKYEKAQKKITFIQFYGEIARERVS